VNPPLRRVTVVDDHSLFGESLAIALRAEGVDARCVVPGAHPAGQSELERGVLETQPDLVLLDLDLGNGHDGMRLLPALVEAGVTVVVVTGAADQLRRGEALHLGARTVISKTVPFAMILEAVRRINNGLPVISRQEREALLAAWRTAATADRDIRRRFDRITRREAEVLGLLMTGHQVSEIAKGRFVSESTVRTQVKSVLAKLQVSSQLTAVGLAHQIGWRPPNANNGHDAPRARRRARQPRPGETEPPRRVGDGRLAASRLNPEGASC
jgi:two-component system nitrate/nitrite response regulator NarL